MANICQASDFDNQPYKIPNLQAVINSFNIFITREEAKVLQQLWGYKTYKDYLDGLLIDPVPDKWVKLRDGGEYTDVLCNKLMNYKGLKSLLIPYLYSLWLRATFDDHARNGIVVPNVENSDVISPATRIINSWEDFRHQVGAKQIRYGNVYHAQTIVAMSNSMVGFILANATNYPDWYIDVPEMQNLWDL